MRVILDLIYHLATPIVLLYLVGPSRLFTRRRYRAGMLQRLGGVPRRQGNRPCLWLHAVSVGELRAAVPLAEGLLRAFPEWDLWVSTSTDTGRDVARKILPPGVQVFYYPLDYGWAVRRSLRRVRPQAIVLLELELWPNFVLAAQEASIPVLVANGRISERSYPHYRRLRALSRGLFEGVTAFAVQSEEYAARFESLGVPRERIDVLGNLKYDALPETAGADSTAEKLGWTERAGPVLMGGSTHAGEEDALAAIWAGLRAKLPGLKLVVAPRHIERAGQVEDVLQTSLGMPVLRWSQIRAVEGAPGTSCAVPRDHPLILIDVVGELDRFFRLSDVVFMGGSLVPHGGHNLLEPARLGKAVVFGPFMNNFAEMAQHLLSSSAAVQVGDRPGLETEIARLIQDPEARAELGERARAVTQALGGATARHIDWIRRKIE